MTPMKEIGELLITCGDRDFFFRPSFANMTRIGDPGEIVAAFYALHHDEVSALLERAMTSYGHIPEWVVQHIKYSTYGRAAMLAAGTVSWGCPTMCLRRSGRFLIFREKPSTTRPCGRGAVPPTRWRRPLNIHGMGPVPPSSGATPRLRAFPPPRRGCPSARTIPCSMPNIRYRRPARCGVSTRPSLRFGPPSGRYSMGSAAC